MADSTRTLSQLLADVLDPLYSGSGLVSAPPTSTSAPYGRGPVNVQALRNLIQALHQYCRGILGSRVVGNSGLQSSDGASQTSAVYQIDMTGGVVLIGGVAALMAALDDQDLLADIDSYALDGSAAVALTNGGKTCDLVLAIYSVDGTATLFGVLGDEAADGAETAPDEDDVYAAMLAAAVADIDLSSGVVIGRLKIQRTTKATWEVGGVIAENDTFSITVNAIESEITADVDDVAADVAGKLRADLTTKLAAEPVTVSGGTVYVIVTGDTGTLFIFESGKVSAQGTLTETQADVILMTHTNGGTGAALVAERSAGTLWRLAT